MEVNNVNITKNLHNWRKFMYYLILILNSKFTLIKNIIQITSY